VDLSDPEDVKILASDPQGEVLVHLSSSDYLDQFKVYVAHLQEWRQQYQKVESVDMRYWESARQIVVNPDLRGVAPVPVLTVAAARAAMSAGVKPAALVVREPLKPLHAPKEVSKPALKAATKPAPKSHWHKKWTPAKHATAKPVPHAAAGSSAPKPPTSATLQKPSPAIAKGQGTP
jgi:cell division protein FtsQ